MIEVRNVAKDRLEAGELALGVGLRQARTVDIGKAMKTAGFDWLFIDMEHNAMSIDTAVQISVAAQDAGITPIVRVPGFEHFHATRALDGGAQGVVVPHVDTPEVAAQMVANTRYPPVGHRSVTGALPQVDFGSHPVGELAPAINDTTLVVVMVETPTAVENVEAIAAVPGIDAILVGTNDLCMEMGIPGQVGDPQVQASMERVIAACKTNNIHAGLGGVYDPPLMKRYVDMGMRLILSGSDLSFMMSAAKDRATFLRGTL
ncbi:MAG: 4-hydroxy-2-oxoheptanedioate aldolase [Gammaproteobacteria bacterium]|jgi:4-hydroxy-2-oxoheptanedioate aldolase